MNGGGLKKQNALRRRMITKRMMITMCSFVSAE
jgi:hypothetical protein